MKLRKKILGLLAAGVLAAAMVPGMAFAANSGTSAVGDLTVTGLSSGDTVEVYKIVDITVADNGSTTYSFAADYGIAMSDYEDYADDSAEMQAAAATIAASSKLGSATKLGNATDTSYTFKDLAAGQYLVKVTPVEGTAVYQYSIATIALQDANGDGAYDADAVDGTVAMKSTRIDIDKKVGSGDAAADSATTYGYGDTVPFSFTVAIPTFPDNATRTQYVVGDTMGEGLTLDTNSITVTVGTTAITSSLADYITANEDGFSIDMSALFTQAGDTGGTALMEQYEGQTLTVTYNATVNDSATLTTSTTTNKAYVTVSSNPYANNDSDDKTDNDEVPLYTAGIELDKVDSTDSNKKLSGAEFAVYAADQVSEGALISDATAVTTMTETSTAGTYQTAQVLGAGTYYIVETKAPAGYQLDATPQSIAITITETADGYTVTTDADADFYADFGNFEDEPLPVLPTTGGAGTVAFTVIGIALMAGAVTLVLRSRRPEQS